MRVILHRVLHAAGARRLRVASDAQSALALLAQRPADLIITDHDMPGMDGAELIASIRAVPALARARIVLISGFAGVDAAEHGADAVLMKPVAPATLLAAIETALSRR